MGFRTKFGIWTFLELLQLSVILFISAIFSSFVIGGIFTQIDKQLDKNCNSNEYKTGIFFIT